MKLSLLVLTLLSFINHNQEERFPKEFNIGVHKYVMTIKKGYNHDDDVTATYFVVNRKGTKSNQISSHKLAEHKDKTQPLASIG